MIGFLACGETYWQGAGVPFRLVDDGWRDVAERLYAKVNPNGPTVRAELGSCWDWTAYVTGINKRPAMSWRGRYPGRPVYASRAVWELHVGPIPSGKQINHHCDNPQCVRLDHLYLGTQLDNLQDASRRGRLHVPRTGTLTPADREAIYAAPGYRGVVRDLAERYGVSAACISVIRRGRFVRVSERVGQFLPVVREHGAGFLDVADGGGETSVRIHVESLPEPNGSDHLQTVETR